MKELSIEEKARRYDEAIETARKINSGDGVPAPSNWNICEVIFPELKESEDERIRKAQLNYWRSVGGKEWYGVPVQETIAWLEKQGEKSIDVLDKEEREFADNIDSFRKEIDNSYQKGYNEGVRVTLEKQCEQKANPVLDVPFGAKDSELQEASYHIPKGFYAEIEGNRVVIKRDEQKPADEAEPKFKVGDFIANDYCFGKVVALTNDAYLLDTEQGIPFSCEHNAHLWTIQDAKDGDVLHSTGWHNDCIFIFNGLDNWKFDEPNGDRAVATGYCCLSVSADNMEFGIQGPDCVEVNTIKPATKIQRDLLYRKMKEAGYEWDAEKKELKKIEQKPAWSEEDELIFISTIQSLKLTNGACDMKIDWLKSLKDRVQPQPQYEWSEEDETTKNNISHIIRQYDKISKRENQPCWYIGDCLLWMQNIKDRVQPKREWSEEDEGILQSIILCLENLMDSSPTGCFNDFNKCINWLNSLRPQSQWKPKRKS